MQKHQHVYQSYCAPKFTLQSKTTSVYEGVSYSVYHGPAVGFPSPLARGPGLYLASYFIYLAPLQWGDEAQRRGGGWRWEAEMRGWGGGGGGGEEYKRIKRGEEGVGERQREEEDVWKAGSSGRIAGRAPVTEEAPAFCHPLLLSFFPSISFCPATGRTPKRGKERVLKIPPSFLCPSPLLKTCCLHSNRPCPHTELIQLVVMNVCVCVFGCVCEAERESVCSLLLMPLCVSVCVSVCLCACCCRFCFCFCFVFFQGRGSINVSPTLRPHSFTETSSLSQFIFGQGSVGWFLNCKKFCFFQSFEF